MSTATLEQVQTDLATLVTTAEGLKTEIATLKAENATLIAENAALSANFAADSTKPADLGAIDDVIVSANSTLTAL